MNYNTSNQRELPPSYNYIRLVLIASQRHAGTLSNPSFLLKRIIDNIVEFKVEQVSLPKNSLSDTKPYYMVCSNALSSKMVNSSSLNGFPSEIIAAVPSYSGNDYYVFHNFCKGSTYTVYSHQPLSYIDLYIVDGAGTQQTLVDDWGITLWLKTSNLKHDDFN